MNGMNFGMDGPQVTGWWYNPKTGDKFNALDTYFEDNNLLIKTADGRMLNYNQIQNYVRVDNPNLIPDKSTFNTPQKAEEIPANILAEIDDNSSDDLLIPDDDIYGGAANKPTTKGLSNPYEAQEKTPSNIQDITIIDRALGGKNTPSITGDIEWKEFPKREIEMLVDVMKIPEQEIVQYYINSISLDDLRDMVAKSIERYINNMQLVGVNTQDKNATKESVVKTTPTPEPLKKKKTLQRNNEQK